jgi:hypothetical protein
VDALLRKLQHRAGEPIVVIAPPAEVMPSIEAWRADADVASELSPGRPFVLVFVLARDDIAARAADAVDKLADDGVLWFAYPKKTSKRYRSDVTRDVGWGPLDALGYEPVRQIAIDDDWSALRFRPKVR